MADESEALFSVLRDSEASEETRQAAFERMLNLQYGWWGPGKLYAFAAAYALNSTRRMAAGIASSPDKLDWESVATEAMLMLYYQASRIHSSPRDWFRAVIRNLVAQELRSNYAFAHAKRLPQEIAAPPPRDESAATARDAVADAAISAAVAALPPSLRLVAQLLLVERLSRKEVATLLGLSPELLRQRIARIRLAFDAARMRRYELTPEKSEKP